MAEIAGRTQPAGDPRPVQPLSNILALFNLADTRVVMETRATGGVAISIPSEISAMWRKRMEAVSYVCTLEEKAQIDQAADIARREVFRSVYPTLTDRA